MQAKGIGRYVHCVVVYINILYGVRAVADSKRGEVGRNEGKLTFIHVHTLLQNATNERCVSWNFDNEGLHCMLVISTSTVLLYQSPVC